MSMYIHVHVYMYCTCQKKLPIPFTVSPFSVPFPRRSVLPFHRSVHRFTVPFCRFTVPSTDYRESGVHRERASISRS